jgi:hypothetical protein
VYPSSVLKSDLPVVPREISPREISALGFDDLLTMEQAATILNISTDTATRRFENHPNVVDVGPLNGIRHLRIRRSDLRDFISSRSGLPRKPAETPRDKSQRSSKQATPLPTKKFSTKAERKKYIATRLDEISQGRTGRARCS